MVSLLYTMVLWSNGRYLYKVSKSYFMLTCHRHVGRLLMICRHEKKISTTALIVGAFPPYWFWKCIKVIAGLLLISLQTQWRQVNQHWVSRHTDSHNRPWRHIKIMNSHQKGKINLPQCLVVMLVIHHVAENHLTNWKILDILDQHWKKTCNLKA